jgi:hypothetical protein
MFGAQRSKGRHLDQIAKRESVIRIDWCHYHRFKATLA